MHPCTPAAELWISFSLPREACNCAAGAVARVRTAVQHLRSLSVAVIIAGMCCMVGRAVAVAAGSPGFELALVAVVADAAGSSVQQLSLIHI